MTDKEWDRLKKHPFGKRGITGYLYVQSDKAKLYLKPLSDWEEEGIRKYRNIYVTANDTFKLNENSISFRTRVYTDCPMRRVNIHYRDIASVRFHDYNY